MKAKDGRSAGGRKEARTGGRWKPGTSGNPGGRPTAQEGVRELARALTSDALRALREVALRGRSESARVAAAVALLDRAWGKPVTEAATVDPEGVPFFAHVRELLLAARTDGDGGREEAKGTRHDLDHLTENELRDVAEILGRGVERARQAEQFLPASATAGA